MQNDSPRAARNTCAAIALAALALAVAGCAPQDHAALGLASAADAPAAREAGALVGGRAAPDVEPAEAPRQPQIIVTTFVPPKNAPLPPTRPGGVGETKLAGAAAQQPATPGQPAAQAPAVTPAPVAQQTPIAAQTPVATPAYAPQPAQPTGLFALFAQPDAAPAPAPAPVAEAPAQPAAPAVTPVPKKIARGSLGAYEKRAAGVPDDDEELDVVKPGEPAEAPANAPAIKPASGQKLAFAFTPASIEVDGVTHVVPPGGAPIKVPSFPEPTFASGGGSPYGSIAGRRWRAAYPDVVTNCFPADLRRALDQIGDHFGREVLVTSGARNRGRPRSMHRFCRAADIRVVGVSPTTVARYASTVPGINGVGTYRRVAVTHIDTRASRMAWRY